MDKLKYIILFFLCTGILSATMEKFRSTIYTGNNNIITNDGKVRKIRDASTVMVNLTHGYYGRVELTINGTTGTICDDGWDHKACKVVCKQLGFRDGIGASKASFEQGVGKIWAEDFSCMGNETSLDRCRHSAWGSHDCSHSEDASCVCSNNSPAAEVKLTEGFYGRVEVSINGLSGTVCDDGWDKSDWQVVCRQLGYRHGFPFSGALFGAGTGRIWIDQVSCLGDEDSLDRCKSSPWGAHQCSHREDASCICGNNSQEVEVTLTQGYYGRVELSLYGLSGTVCDDGWDDNDCQVVCRQLGYRHWLAVPNGQFGAGTGRIWLDDVSCLGNEDSLNKCSHTPWGTHDCKHEEDASCVCSNSGLATKGTLTEGYYGRVEVSINGVPGTICDDEWDDNDCRVVCRQLGYQGGLAEGGAHFGQGEGVIWGDNFRCSGDEVSLDSCERNKWGTHNCDHSEDASCICDNTTLTLNQTSYFPEIAVNFTEYAPNYGPADGGTVITLVGDVNKDSFNSFFLRKGTTNKTEDILPCEILHNKTDNKHVYIKTPSVENRFVGMRLFIHVTVTYNIGASPVPVDTGFQFTYKENPLITKIMPKQIFLSGGVPITATGRFLDSVANPVMYIDMERRLYNQSTDTFTVEETISFKSENTSFLNSNTIIGIAPEINTTISSENLQYPLRARTRNGNDSSLHINSEGIEFFVGFQLDGTTKYRNLSEAIDPDAGNILVYRDPVIYQFENVKIYDPTVESFIEIKGGRLNLGAELHNYYISIGDARCEVVDLTENSLICQPPSKEPNVNKSARFMEGKPEVSVVVGYFTFHVGHIDYIDANSPTMIYILVGLGAGLFVVVVTVVTAVIWCKRNNK